MVVYTAAATSQDKERKTEKIIDTNQQAVLAASSNAIVTAVNKQPNDLSKAFPESGKP